MYNHDLNADQEKTGERVGTANVTSTWDEDKRLVSGGIGSWFRVDREAKRYPESMARVRIQKILDHFIDTEFAVEELRAMATIFNDIAEAKEEIDGR